MGKSTYFPKRDWIFTLNNPNPRDMEMIHNCESIRYMAYQLELSETGTEHLQGYVEFNQPLDFKEVLEIFSDGKFHLEFRRGTREQARDYCTKEQSRIRGPWFVGEWLVEEEEERCQGFTQKDERCRNFCTPGMKTCNVHKEQR